MGNTFVSSRARSWRSRTAAALGAVGALIMSSGVVLMTTATTAEATPGDPHKVWICHATSSDTNPYVIIDVDVASIKKIAAHEAHKAEPNKRWKTDGTWSGVSHKADDPKPDIIGTPGDAAPPALCFDQGPSEPPAPTTLNPSISITAPDCNNATVTWAGKVGGVADGPDDHVDFDLTDGTVGPGNSIVVTAIAENGFVFDNGTQEKDLAATFAALPSNCVTPPPAPPVNDPCGPNNASFTLPTGDPKVVWSTLPNGNAQVVPAAGFVFTGASQTLTFTLPADSGAACLTTPPGTPLGSESASPEPEVLGTESVSPKPEKTKKPKPAVVLGTEAAVPTAVDAGLGSLPAAAPAQGSLLGQLLTGAGIALMLAAGWLMTVGRREVGAREA